MRLPSRIRSGLLLLPLLAAGCGGTAEFRPRADASILIILIDVLRADHVGSYGYSRDTTPRIDSLARRGVRFEHAISSSSWTRPSVSSLFTSLDPLQHGVLIGFNQEGEEYYLDVLEEDQTTLAEVLLANGWETVAVAPNAYTRPEFGFGQGFSTFFPHAEDAAEVVDHFLGWLESEPRDRFFAYLHFMDVHWPYDPPPPYDDMFGTFPTSLDFDTLDWNELRQWIRAYRAPLTGADIDQMVARYDGGTRFVDDEVSRLLDRLEEAGRLEDTLVVVTSDHGEEFMERGRLGHGRFLYDYLLRVPLILRFPGDWAAGTRIRAQVRLVDLMPTLLEAVGLRAPTELSGHSLLRLIGTGGRDPEMPVLAFSEHMRGDHLYRQSVRSERFKFIRSFRPPAAGSSDAGTRPADRGWDQEEYLLSLVDGDPAERPHVLRELYDLRADPGERRNLLRSRPETVRAFEAELDRYMRSRRKWIVARAGTKTRIDPETVRELCNLGYIQCEPGKE